MLIYGSVIAITYFSSLIAGIPSRHNWKMPPRLLPVLMAIVLLTLFCGLRYETGTDTETYYYWYERNVPFEKFADARDFGFSLLCKAIYHFISPDPQVMFLIVALITSSLMISTIWRYGRPFELAMLLYLVTGIYFFSFNGIRQALAAAVIFAGAKFIFERDWVRSMAVILLAASFHSSALLLIPMYFIADSKGFSWRHFVIAGAVIFFFFLYGDVVSGIFDAVGSNKYGAYSTVLTDTSEGASIFRFLVQVSVFAIAVTRSKQLVALYPKTAMILINYSFLALLFTLISLKHCYYARVAFYPSVFNILLLSYLPKSFGRQSSIIIYTGIIICYLLYFFLLLQSGESNLIPYRSILGT